MITIDFSKREKKGLCDYLYESIKAQILTGELSANEKLPSKRALADHLGVSVITVQNAYSLLCVEGYLYSIEKKGFFVTDIKNDVTMKSAVLSKSEESKRSKTLHGHSAPKKQESYLADFSSNATGFEKFPFSLWAKTMRSVLASGNKNLLLKTEAKGVFELREAIAKHLYDFREMRVSPEQIVIGAGTESLYTMLIQLLGTRHCYAVENPGYKKIASVFALNGADCVPVEIDGKGMNPLSLKKIGASVVHISPSHHFPTGIVMPIRRRNELLAWASEVNEKECAEEKISERERLTNGRYIIEDDYDSEFRFQGKPLPTLQSSDKNGRVIYINTFTKTLAPSFRISYMVLPESLVSRFDELFAGFSSTVSAFEQFTLAQFITDGNFARHIIRMKNYYRSLRNELISAFSKTQLSEIFKIHEEESGLHFLLSVNSEKFGRSATEINERLLANKIKIPLLSDFYYTPIPKENENVFVVNYSGIQKNAIAKIVELMEKSLDF